MKVKICGVTRPEDAELAGREGADYVGLLLSAASPRLVEGQQAQEIVLAAWEAGASPIGLFVDGSAPLIQKTHKELKLGGVQLISSPSKLEKLMKELSREWFYFLHLQVDSKGHSPSLSFQEEWKGYLLCDAGRGGEGRAFNWELFQPPPTPYFVAGGLSPENVARAIARMHPAGVDVSSGVAGKDGLAKDPERVKRFIERAKRAIS